MSRRRASKSMSPLILPIVAVVLTLVVAGLVLFFSLLTREKLVPVPGPTVTMTMTPTPSSTNSTPAPSPSKTAQAPTTVPNNEVEGDPLADLPEAAEPIPPAQQPAPQQQAPQGQAQQPQPARPNVPAQPQPQPTQQPVQPQPPQNNPGPIIGTVNGVTEEVTKFLCSIYCP